MDVLGRVHREEPVGGEVGAVGGVQRGEFGVQEIGQSCAGGIVPDEFWVLSGGVVKGDGGWWGLGHGGGENRWD